MNEEKKITPTAKKKVPAAGNKVTPKVKVKTTKTAEVVLDENKESLEKTIENAEVIVPAAAADDIQSGTEVIKEVGEESAVEETVVVGEVEVVEEEIGEEEIVAAEVIEDAEVIEKFAVDIEAIEMLPLTTIYSTVDEARMSIEGKRKIFTSFYQKQKRFNMILMGVLIVCLAGGIFLITIPSIPPPVIYIFLAVIICLFAGMFIFSGKAKKIMNVNVTNYLEAFLSGIDCYAFSHFRFNDVKRCSRAKLVPEEFFESHMFETINTINSRNRLEGKCGKHSFYASDVAVKIPGAENKKDQMGFYGKFIGVDFLLKNNLSVIIVLKGTDTVGPTDLVDYELTPIEGLERFEVYTNSPIEAIKQINKNAVESLARLTINDNLLDCFVAINEKGTKIGFSYTDDIMALPLQQEFKAAPLEEYYNNVNVVFDFIAALEK